jgi:hypothetical protein
MHECAMELIQAGFRPDELEYLCTKIRFIIQQTIKTTVEKYHIPIPLSTKAFIVPGKSDSLISEHVLKFISDPLGILKEGEIFYRSSQEILNPDKQTLYNVVTGDVLVCPFF